jgi:hypothetical protein
VAQPFVLVLMPFSEQFSDIYTGIEAAIVQAGARCERVDKQKFDQNILQQIYDMIREADIIVADMSGKNPNVFYETGYAHALGKSVVLLVQDVNDIPFDLKHYTHIIYDGKISKLKPELETWIKWHIDNPKSTDSEDSLPLIKVSSQLVEKQVHALPSEWCSRSLYLGLTGAQNWLSIVTNANQPYRADYFKSIGSKLLREESLKDIKVRALVSFGPGHGETDKLLCKRLKRKENVRYVPVDINPFLLTTSISRVGSSARAEFGVVCDFEDELIPFLKDSLEVHSQGPFLFSMLGYTFGNLDGREGKFFTDMEDLMNQGDYMLLDYIAIDDQWKYEDYSSTWYLDWDNDMRKFLCDAVAKRWGEDNKEVRSSFEKRFSFERGKSDVEDAHATYIMDQKTGALVTNIRRYQKLGDWLNRTFSFEVVTEYTYVDKKNNAGYGYILIKK